ncbi:MAG: hypothetical protein AAF329_12075 [Cyanobacteria bacterium P01_A01_bin.17]
MGKAVAVEKDVIATPGTVFFPPADSGAWTAGPVTETPDPKLTAGKKQVIYQATCTFSFSGANSASGATVTGTEVVTLSAKPTKLQGKTTKVLVDSDSATGVLYANQLKVVASQTKLLTS